MAWKVAIPAPAWIVAGLALIATLIPSTNAAYVQWIRCPDGRGGTQGFDDLWPTSNRARIIPDNVSSGQHVARTEFGVSADYMGKATCAELLEKGPANITIRIEAMNLSKTYAVRPSSWTCLPYQDRPAWERRHLANNESQIRLVVQVDLEVLGLLPTFAAELFLSAGNDSDATEAPPACIYSEITPQLHKHVSTAVRYGPIGVFLLVFVSGLLATLTTPTMPLRARSSSQAAEHESRHTHVVSRPHGVIAQWAILPGVADCLLHLQFIFFMGALTLRYPGFYQPVTSLFHWSALFSPSGPFGQDGRYNMVKDGIYEINGTLTGTYGLELTSQITGGPLTMDVWWNMVVITTVITAVVTVFILARKSAAQLAPFLSFMFPEEKGFAGQGPISESAIARGTWNVLRVVLSYFLTPIVAISAYQLDNVLLPAYHLALATLLITLVMIGLVWMWRIAPTNQLWVLLLDSSKRYRRIGTSPLDNDGDPGPPDTNRDVFAGIFFALAFARGIAVGGFQFSPLAQVIGLAATEMALLISTAVLRPLRGRILFLFTWLGVARLVVVGLTAVFLPEVNASLMARSRVGIAILVIHAVVLVLGCAIPATMRLVGLVSPARDQVEEPEIYGLRQLRRRDDNPGTPTPTSDGIFNSRMTNSPTSHHRHSRRSPSEGSGTSFYLDSNSSPDVLYLRAISPHHYFRQPQTSSCNSLRRSYEASGGNVSPVSSTNPLTLELGPSRQGEDASASTSPPSIITAGQPQRPYTCSPNVTTSDAAEPSLFSPGLQTPPLAPRWSDYSFREADLYYGRPQCVEDSGAASATAAAPTLPPQTSTVRQVISHIPVQLTTWASRLIERQRPHKGFEVQRPPKPASA